MRILAHIGVGYLLLVLLGGIWRVTPFQVVSPDLTLIFAVYLGMALRSEVWKATAGIVVIGYLADVLAGSPRGLSSVVMGTVCILCRLVSARLLLRGRLFIGAFTFFAAIGAGLMTIGLRAYFAAGMGGVWDESLVLLGSAFLTGLLSPMVFRILRGLDARFARTQREREAVREGYLS
jgi:rod shape-determining protein MreD